MNPLQLHFQTRLCRPPLYSLGEFIQGLLFFSFFFFKRRFLRCCPHYCVEYGHCLNCSMDLPLSFSLQESCFSFLFCDLCVLVVFERSSENKGANFVALWSMLGAGKKGQRKWLKKKKNTLFSYAQLEALFISFGQLEAHLLFLSLSFLRLCISFFI